MNNFKTKVSLLALLLLLPASYSIAQESTVEALSGFKQFQKVPAQSIVVPTIVELPLKNIFIERSQFGVLDINTNIFQPYLYRNTRISNSMPLTISTDAVTAKSQSRLMIDNRLETYASFELPPDDTLGTVTISIRTNKPITSSRLSLILDNHVALPTSVRIVAGLSSSKVATLFATTKPTSSTVTFPKTTAQFWSITLTYAQPLRISELKLEQLNTSITESEYIRFLAQPNTSYEVYFNPDRNIAIRTPESGNLSRNDEILIIPIVPTLLNPKYVQADIDKDGIPDSRDNCTNIKNADQTDINANGRGDACDDFDRDGRVNSADNCINQPNSNQKDTDGDGIGDACDEEESRITEKYKWIPWLGISIAAIVIFILFAKTVHEMKKSKEDEEEESNNPTDPPQDNTGTKL